MFYGLCVIWCRLRILIGDEIGELKQSPSKLEMWPAWLLVCRSWESEASCLIPGKRKAIWPCRLLEHKGNASVR